MTKSKIAVLVAGTLGVAWLVHHHRAAHATTPTETFLADLPRGTQHLVDMIAMRTFGSWRADHLGGTCAQALPTFRSFGEGRGKLMWRDSWHHALRYTCDDDGQLVVTSPGVDGAFGTADDISSRYR